MNMKPRPPLFIPLKREYYEAFERGEKDTEYRLPGGRWNEYTCGPGRRVCLSLGYGRKNRLFGTVVSFGVHALDGEKWEAFKACYPGKPNLAACIRIRLWTKPTAADTDSSGGGK